MTSFLPAIRTAAPRWKSTPLIVGVAGILTLAGCGKAPDPAAAPSAEATPEGAQPAGSPSAGKPSLVVQPPATPATAGKIVYVIEGFQAVNADGTHEIPTGAEVKVVKEIGDEYLIAYQNLSVRTWKSYFSETPIEETAAPAPTPVAAAPTPTPDTIPLPSDQPSTEPAAAPAPVEPIAASTPAPEATPDAARAADDAKAQELMNQIVSVDSEIRTATDKMEIAPAAEKAKEAAKIEKLKKRRDALGASLTEVAKP